MARGNKITITINESRRSATISWTCSGSSGALVLSQENGTIPNTPLPPTTSNKAYFASVLATVSAALV